MTNFRKRRWQAQNRKRANQRAAKARLRRERLRQAEDGFAPTAKVPAPSMRRPLFLVTIRCRDGAEATLRIHEGPFGLLPSATLAGRKVAAVLAHYRPSESNP